MRKSQKGYVALISVLVMGAVGVSVGVSLILLGLSFSRTSLVVEQSNQAKALANACSEEALQKIREGINFSGSGNLSLASGTCSYTVTKLTGKNRTISATGTVGTIVRKVSIQTSSMNPSVTVTSWQEVP